MVVGARLCGVEEAAMELRNLNSSGAVAVSARRTSRISTYVGLAPLYPTAPAAPPAVGQQVTGAPGSPSATTTIEGNQLPPPPQKFEGKIERNAAQSRPYWPARVVPPKGAPNV